MSGSGGAWATVTRAVVIGSALIVPAATGRPAIPLGLRTGETTGTTGLVAATPTVLSAALAPRPMSPNNSPITEIATPEKITRELGWSPRFSDVRAIAETAWRWHDSHPNGYASRGLTS